MASISNIATSATTRVLDRVLDLTLCTTNTGAAFTGPPRVRLMATNGTITTLGTEITAGGGYTAGGTPVTFGSAAANGSGSRATNSAAATWTNMPSATVNGLELWDQSGTPIRLHFGAITGAPKTINSGDTFSFAIGAIVVDIT